MASMLQGINKQRIYLACIYDHHHIQKLAPENFFKIISCASSLMYINKSEMKKSDKPNFYTKHKLKMDNEIIYLSNLFLFIGPNITKILKHTQNIPLKIYEFKELILSKINNITVNKSVKKIHKRQKIKRKKTFEPLGNCLCNYFCPSRVTRGILPSISINSNILCDEKI